MSGILNDQGQYAYYGRVGGCIITGNEDGVKHCGMSILYALQHLGYVIPPQADAGWIGEVGPGASYLDPGSGGPENDFTQRNTTFMTWNLLQTSEPLGMQVVDSTIPILSTDRRLLSTNPALWSSLFIQCTLCAILSAVREGA